MYALKKGLHLCAYSRHVEPMFSKQIIVAAALFGEAVSHAYPANPGGSILRRNFRYGGAKAAVHAMLLQNDKCLMTAADSDHLVYVQRLDHRYAPDGTALRCHV